MKIVERKQTSAMDYFTREDILTHLEHELLLAMELLIQATKCEEQDNALIAVGQVESLQHIIKQFKQLQRDGK